MEKEIEVQEKDKNERLDKFLHRLLPEYSRSFLQKNIRSGRVKVNGKNSSVHYFLKPGEKIEVSLMSPTGLKIQPDVANKPEIVFENSDFFVVNKPAGLLVHPAEGQTGPTLAEQMLGYFPALAKVGEDSLRPGIVHRLDREASGLMVIAKNQDAFDHLKQQFKSRQAKKEYIALVQGKIQKEEGVIDFSIARSKKGNFAAKPKKEEGKKALTEYELIRNIKKYSLLKVRTLTGRTHQIRIHFTALGYPLAGDKIYKPKKSREKIKFDRLFLHAVCLGFYDLKNNWQEFKAELSHELEEILKRLES